VLQPLFWSEANAEAAGWFLIGVMAVEFWSISLAQVTRHEAAVFAFV
jgi:hypothetical protein